MIYRGPSSAFLPCGPARCPTLREAAAPAEREPYPYRQPGVPGSRGSFFRLQRENKCGGHHSPTAPCPRERPGPEPPCPMLKKTALPHCTNSRGALCRSSYSSTAPRPARELPAGVNCFFRQAGSVRPLRCSLPSFLFSGSGSKAGPSSGGHRAGPGATRPVPSRSRPRPQPVRETPISLYEPVPVRGCNAPLCRYLSAQSSAGFVPAGLPHLCAAGGAALWLALWAVAAARNPHPVRPACSCVLETCLYPLSGLRKWPLGSVFSEENPWELDEGVRPPPHSTFLPCPAWKRLLEGGGGCCSREGVHSSYIQMFYTSGGKTSLAWPSVCRRDLTRDSLMSCSKSCAFFKACCY